MSIVAMKRKMEAKRGLSTGGKGFSLNPKVKCGDVNSATVKSARQARQNLVKRDVCFSGSEGIQCERVWDGKRQANCMGSGDSMTQEEYIEKKRTSAASCKNVVFNFTNTIVNESTVIVEYDTEKQRYEIEYDGNRYQVDWNHTNKYVGNVLSTIGNVEFETVVGGAKTQCLLLTSVINIVNDIAGGTGNKYVFNGETTYGADISFGVFDGNYNIMNIPQAHPIGLLNNGKEALINWTIDDSTPIIINVAGGTPLQNANGDYFTFTDVNDAVINIGDQSFKFMRDRTYRFVDAGITNGYGFVFNMGVGNPLDTLGWIGAENTTSNEITNVSSISAVNIINGDQYRLNGATDTTDISFGMTDGTYKFTGVPEQNPLGIISGAGLTYSVDDSTGPIVINVTGGDTTANSAGDYYTFTDVDGNTINLGDGSFKFMRGRSYRFVNGGIPVGHQMKIYANGTVSAEGLGNSVPTTLAPGCLDSTLEVDVTAIKTTGGSTDFYDLPTFNVFDGEYRFTNIPQSNPIAFLNNSVSGISYRVDNSTPIYIGVHSPNQGAVNNDDYYSFHLSDANGAPGQPIRIRDGSFKFMRGQVYHFIVTQGGLGGHPFEIIHNGSSAGSIQNSGESIEIPFDENHPFDSANPPPVPSFAPPNLLYYRCTIHSNMKADLALSVFDNSTGGSDVYDFFYGTVIVTIDSAFDAASSSVKFRDLGGIQSNNGLAYTTSCQVGNADGVSEINVTIGAGHSIVAGDLYYVHQDTGVADVNMSLTAVDVGGGVIVDHFYGDIDVVVTDNFGDASVRNLAGDFNGGANLITYGENIQTVISSVAGVSSLDIKIDSQNVTLTTTGALTYKKIFNGSETGITGQDLTVNTTLFYKNAADGNAYDYYYGDLNLTVGGDFGDVSVDCFYHGAMGGTNLLTYTDKCDINLAGTGDANGPATLVVRSFSNTEPRTVELATEADKPVVMSFKNPEKFIFKPVGCDALSAGSGLGGTAGADNRGYYGRGRCKVHYVNKSPQFQINTYTGAGGYLDKLKRPNTDISFCG